MTIRIKVCGITRYEDARVAVNLGVDALGFIFYPASPRYISPSDAAQITKKLPPFVSKVGVFVNEKISALEEIACEAGTDTIQLHGSETPEYCRSVPFPVIKAFSVKPTSDLDTLSEYDVQGFLLDTWKDGLRGGTGSTFDWNIAIKACSKYKNIILAGGLGPSNIAEALESVSPYAVDVNSGVEISPGVKNPLKLRDVITLVKKWRYV